ncbi:pentatricopeptide repeat-containing protein [Carex littledalei]|uniref:Pentatricopeptide repeat-containing protein n=1 Tax=Carex littledalei TaxID=544730 RepID=A0A833R0M6_9POAL|nr:pentatricopeptide repeat-containing protein [Carex littledalei]
MPKIHEIIIYTFCKNRDYEGAVEVLKDLLERCFAARKALLDEFFEGIYEARKTSLVEKLRSEAQNVGPHHQALVLSELAQPFTSCVRSQQREDDLLLLWKLPMQILVKVSMNSE